MSVEKMEMMNVIGYLDDLDRVSMEVIRQGCVHIVNALAEINQNNFAIMTPNQNTNILTDLCFIKPYGMLSDFVTTYDKLVEIMDLFGLEKCIRKKYMGRDIAFGELKDKVDYIYGEAKSRILSLEDIKSQMSKLRELRDYMGYMHGIKLDLNVLKNLRFFNFKLGKMSRENYEKLKDNIENVSSIVYELSSTPDGYVIVSLTPRVLEAEVDRIMASLNFDEISVPYELGGTPDEIIGVLDERIGQKQSEINKYNDELIKLGEKYCSFLDETYSIVKMYEKIQSVNMQVACTNDFFYMAGWVPVSEKEGLQRRDRKSVV